MVALTTRDRKSWSATNSLSCGTKQRRRREWSRMMGPTRPAASRRSDPGRGRTRNHTTGLRIDERDDCGEGFSDVAYYALRVFPIRPGSEEG